MIGLPRILLTRKFRSLQLKDLIAKGWMFIHHDFIEKRVTVNDLKRRFHLHPNVAFTSTMGVRAFIQLAELWNLKTDRFRIFCISEATKSIAEAQGLTVQASAPAAALLKDEIVKNKIQTITQICGNLRTVNLQDQLRQAHVEVQEVVAYHVALTPRLIHDPYCAIVFLSPSAIDSFLMLNKTMDVPCFCIGDTTAGHAAKVGFKKIYVADSPNEESLLKLMVEYFEKKTVRC